MRIPPSLSALSIASFGESKSSPVTAAGPVLETKKMPDYQRPDATGKIIEPSSKTKTYYRRRGKRYVDQVRSEIHDPNASLSTVVDHLLVSGRRYKLSSQAAMTAWLRQLAVDGCADPANEVAAEALRKL